MLPKKGWENVEEVFRPPWAEEMGKEWKTKVFRYTTWHTVYPCAM